MWRRASLIGVQRDERLSSFSKRDLTHLGARHVHEFQSGDKATVALLDAANVAHIFGHVADVLGEALHHVVDLEVRIEALERKLALSEVDGPSGGRLGLHSQLAKREDMRSHVDTNTAARLLSRTPQNSAKMG